MNFTTLRLVKTQLTQDDNSFAFNTKPVAKPPLRATSKEKSSLMTDFSQN